MKKLIVMAVAALVAVSSMAWMGDSVINAYLNGTSAWYNGSLDSDMTDFNGANLGELYSLTLGAQVQTYPIADNSSARLGYQVYETTADDSAWQEIEMPWARNEGNNSYWATGGNWDSPAQTAISFDGLEDGKTYNIAVYFAGAIDGEGTGDSGNNFVASFTKVAAPVPEPATMSLLGLGALAMVIRRKLRK